jgi:hypothetical protein
MAHLGRVFFLAILLLASAGRTQGFAVRDSVVIDQLTVVGMIDKVRYGPQDSVLARTVLVNHAPGGIQFRAHVDCGAMDHGCLGSNQGILICEIRSWDVYIPHGRSVLKEWIFGPLPCSEQESIHFQQPWEWNREPSWSFRIPVNREPTALQPLRWSQVKMLFDLH